MKIEDMPMITDPNIVYSEVYFPHNIKMREVYCQVCNYRTVTDLSGPKCKACDNAMINIVKSHFDK